MEKQNMLFSQLSVRGITNDEVLRVLSFVDREDHVSGQDRSIAYSDAELPYENNRVIVRSFVLAKILERVVEFSKESALIIGDLSGYTAAVFQEIFQSVTIGTLHNSETSKLREKILDIPIGLMYDVKQKFDVVFLDGGIFREVTIQLARTMLAPQGHLVYFSRKPSFDFVPQRYEFYDISVIIETATTQDVILAQSLLFPSETIS